jgi:hypothetical protein
MRITIVYESMFGNTHQVAEAIAAGAREAVPDAQVLCLAVTEASSEGVVTSDVLVVGGPTHMRGMTSPMSRKMSLTAEDKHSAAGEPTHQLEPDAEGPGLRDWFDRLPKLDDERSAAAFDTRLPSRLAGGAAHGIARRLRRHGYHLVAEPEGFVVDESYGPLRAGEIERAKEWGRRLVSDAVRVAG